MTRWRNAYLERGLDGLRPRKAQGAPGKIPTKLADAIKRWVSDGPAKQGLDRANGTHAALANHLFKTHGIRTSRSAMHRFCSKIGTVPTAPPTASCVATPTRGFRPARTSPR
jgi:transposase